MGSVHASAMHPDPGDESDGKAPSDHGTGRRATLQSVERAFDVLDYLTASPASATLTEVATGTGLERTVVNRILRTLQAEQVVQRADDRYELGPRALLYGFAYHDRLALPPAALPFMMEFVKGYAERRLLVAVVVPVGDRIVIVDRAWHPDIRLDLVFALGSQFDIDQSATGRAILAAVPDAEVGARIGAARHGAIADQLARIRKDRVDFREGPEGNCVIGAAVLNRRGYPVGGLAVAGLGVSDQLHPDSVLAEHLRGSVDRLGQMIG